MIHALYLTALNFSDQGSRDEPDLKYVRYSLTFPESSHTEDTDVDGLYENSFQSDMLCALRWQKQQFGANGDGPSPAIAGGNKLAVSFVHIISLRAFTKNQSPCIATNQDVCSGNKEPKAALSIR
jgi:hypothetical protein